MLLREQVKEAVFRALDQVKELSLDETAVPDSEPAVLLGEGAGLDSMGFVNFVVALEDEMAKIGTLVDIAGSLNAPGTEATLTVGALIDFLHSRVCEKVSEEHRD